MNIHMLHQERKLKKRGNKTSSYGISRTNESKLSSKAQDFLKGLRSRYGDYYDFLIGNSTDDLKALAKSGTKEFSVIFSNAELEKMANDEKYTNEKLQGVERAVKMSEEINQKYGFQSAFGEAGASNGSLTAKDLEVYGDYTIGFELKEYDKYIHEVDPSIPSYSFSLSSK